MSIEPSDLVSALKRYKVSDLFGLIKISEDADRDKVIVLAADTLINTAFETLCSNHVHSAPVVSSKNEFLGMVDLRDFVSYMISLFKHDDLSGASVSSTSEGPTLLNTIGELINFSKANPTKPVREDDTLDTVFKLFLEDKALHRVPVLRAGDSHEILRILSHSSIIQFFEAWSKHEGFYQGSVWEKALESIDRLGFKQAIHQVTTTNTLFETFRILLSTGVNALPIVDHTGKLQGSISISDVQYGVLKNLDHLREPLSYFLVSASRNADHLFDDQEYLRLSSTPITVSLTTPLNKAISLMAHHHINHLWVVNDANEPVSVITAFDLLTALDRKSVV